MAFVSFSPTKQYAGFSTLTYPTVIPTPIVITTELTPVQGTTAELLGGLLLIDCQDAGDYQLPDAADLVTAIEGCTVNTSFQLLIKNQGDETVDLLIAETSGGFVDGANADVNQTHEQGQGTTSYWMVVITDVTPGSEAYIFYFIGDIDQS